MRTTIDVEDGLFEDLVNLTRARTKTEAVRLALREFIRLKRKEELLGLRDSVAIDDTWADLRAAEMGEPGASDA